MKDGILMYFLRSDPGYSNDTMLPENFELVSTDERFTLVIMSQLFNPASINVV
jgi:hypothetical protein